MKVEAQPSLPSVVLHCGPLLHKLNDHEFFEFCQLNSGWRKDMPNEEEDPA